PAPAAVPVPASYRPLPPLTPTRLLSLYSALSKSRLSVLVVLTAMSGVALSPHAPTLSVLLATATGTLLCSASANALNQLQEAPFDAQMARTRARPLVRHALSPLHAAAFASATAVAGPALLWSCVNPTTALLGAANIALYAGLYTYMKRRTVWNTWLGAVVGGIPPLMGWTACGGHLLPAPLSLSLPPLFLPFASAPALPLSAVDNPLAPLALFLFLYAWQFPHFNALAHVVRHAYAHAGFRMLAVLDPRRNAAVALRHALLLVALRHALLLVALSSLLVPLSGLTTWAFALSSLPPNAVCVAAAYRFWKRGGDRAARTVFRHSLWYLPVVMGLMMVHKQGMDW
ncbi:UbiA prenyltransferase family, partial [Amylostereum chailletii]